MGVTSGILVGNGRTVTRTTVVTNYHRCFNCPVAPRARVTTCVTGEVPGVNNYFLRTRDRVTTVGVICNITSTKLHIVASSSDPKVSLGNRNLSCLTNTSLPSLMVGMRHNNPKLNNVRPSRSSCFRTAGTNNRNSFEVLILTPTSIRRVTSLAIGNFRLTSGCHVASVVLTSNAVNRVVRPISLRCSIGPVPRGP